MAIPTNLPKLVHEGNVSGYEQTDSSSSLPADCISQQAEIISPKGRAVSKLSSRHRRRKRLGAHENEDRSAKRNKERIPIPAFTSVPSEFYDFGDDCDCGGGRAPEPSMATRADTDTNHCLLEQESEESICRDECTNKDSALQPDFGHTREKRQAIDGTLDEPTSSTLPLYNEEMKCAENPWEVGQSKGALHIENPASLSFSNSVACSTIAGKGVVMVTDGSGATISSTSAAPASETIDNLQPASLRANENLSFAAVISLQSGVRSESKNDTQSSARAAVATATALSPMPRECLQPGIERRVDDRIGHVFQHCQFDQSLGSNKGNIDARLMEEKELQAEMSRPNISPLHVNSTSETLKSFVSDESSSSLDVSQANQIIDLCSSYDTTNIFRGKNEKRSHSEYFRANTTRSSDCVEIVDDSVGAQNVIGAVPKTIPQTNALHLAAKNEKPSKSDNAQRKRKTAINAISSGDNVSNNAEEIVEKKSSTRHRTETRTRAKSGDNVAKRKQSNGKKKLCSACSNCDCTTGSSTDATSQKSYSISGSDARQEQSLINRLQRLEREIAWKEGQRYDIARALKKHQLKMLKKWGDSNSVAQKPRFLADVGVSDEVEGSRQKIDSKESICARNRVFGKQKTEQPTLTQMVREQTRDDHPGGEPSTVDEGLTEKVDCTVQGNKLINACHDSISDAHADFLSFWTNTDAIQDSTQRYGTMSHLNNALANYNGLKSIDHWAKATAAMLHVEDQGFNALVTLFDESLEKHYSTGSSCCSPSTENDECGCTSNNLNLTADPITPDSKRVATQIESSVRNDPQQMAAIGRMCPQWAENIEFAQAQTDPDIVQKALQNVKNATADLISMKDRVLRAFVDRHQTLTLFAKSLQVSRDRLDNKQDEDCPTSQATISRNVR